MKKHRSPSFLRPQTIAVRSTRQSVFSLICAVGLCFVGCTRTTQTTRTVLFDEPVINQGLFIEEEDPHRLRELAEALDAIQVTGDQAAAEMPPALAEDSETSIAPERLSIGVAAGMVPDETAPPGSAQIIALPKMSEVEIGELLDYVVLRLGADHGYSSSGVFLEDALPYPPEGISADRLVARGSGDQTFVIRLGHRTFLSQPPQFWVFGVIIAADETLTVNPDAASIGDLVAAALTSLSETRGAVTVNDLETRLVQLSYTDAPTAVKLLKAMGVQAFEDPTATPAEIQFDQLPYVVAIPDPAAEVTGLVGKASAASGQNKFGLSLTPNEASQLPGATIASPMTQLLVLFHPARPEQYSRVRRLLDERIDRPARQIFVEGLVLEISEEGLKDLGIEWEIDGGSIVINGGVLTAGGIDDTLGITLDDFFDPEFDWSGSVELRALIREGKAEVLSRPSVLTLNNRQATIRVGKDIPIATSQEGLSGFQNKLVFNFSYLATGIMLNVRPRANEPGSEVSMLIDTIVSDRVRGADLEIRSRDGDLLATAPTVSTRRVQTYARIRNNTPFIIGGLVAKEFTQIQDKIPFLGDLPWIGPFFRAERNESEKREVIIVLTPHVLPEYQDRLVRSLPKDEDSFDSFGNELFRDSYRIRTEDVFDLAFLRENRRLTSYRELATEAISRNFRLAAAEPFDQFAGGRVPGEAILVIRMMYEVVKRLDMQTAIEIPRVIFFEGKQLGGYDVRFLDQTMGTLVNGRDHEDFFERLNGKALALTYTFDRASLEPGRLASEPIPAVSLVECPDRETWGNLLWELNQPTTDGTQRFTILIHDESDLVRLQRALVLKRIVTLNGGEEQLRFANFAVGRTLLMPELKAGQVHVADADVARLFFATEHYYAALIQQLERSLNGLDSALRDPALGMPDLREQLEVADGERNGALDEMPE